MTTTVDDEWLLFLNQSSKNDDNYNDNYNGNCNDNYNGNDNYNDNIDDNYNDNINGNYNDNYNDNIINNNEININKAPEPTNIYISTKSKIAYLNIAIDLNIFWDIPIISYNTPTNGVLKKQMKFVSLSEEQVQFIENKLKNETYYEQYIISHIDNPNSRIKYKDVRKISIGISKKDIMSCRIKKKQAFYNCFVMIIRLNIDGIFKEYHTKIFNTGKVEIPGIQNDYSYNQVLNYIIELLQPHMSDKLMYGSNFDTVLINSNFNCGYQINRDILYEILKYKYKFHAIYDPCSYPGIQCKFYYNINEENQTGVLKLNKDSIQVSFMIFRTGSILIVGMCEEYVIQKIYEVLKEIFKNEFHKICYKIIDLKTLNKEKEKKKKIRKRIINVYSNIETTHTT
jgi:hypothetical protein